MRTFTLCVYVCAVFTLTSFKKADTGDIPLNGLYFVVNNQPFAKSNSPITAQLAYKPALINGKAGARTYIDINILPAAEITANQLRIEINYAKNVAGSPPVYCINMQYNGGNYFAVKEESRLNITALTTYQGAIKLSATFEGVMRSYGYPQDGSHDLTIAGRMDNLTVSVPGWLAAKI